MWLVSLVSILYLSSAIMHGWMFRKQILKFRAIYLVDVLALVLHAILLHQWIDIAGGQDLSLANLVACVVWLLAVFILLFSWMKALYKLWLPVSLLAILSIIWVQYRTSVIIKTVLLPKLLLHVVLSLVVSSMLLLVVLLALFVYFQHCCLRKPHTISWIQAFPPLQTTEWLLFRLIAVLFVLLSVELTTSLIFFISHDLTMWWLKVLLTTIVWCVLGILLLGHYRFGWRGLPALYGTFLSLLVLSILYCLTAYGLSWV